MRNRHEARVCPHCHAPMASGADTCWRCGVEWATEAQPATTLRLVPPVQPDAHGAPVAVTAPAAAAAERSR